MGKSVQRRTVALVTVRSGSTRLKNKFKRGIGGKPMMVTVVDAVRKSKVDEVVVATVYADTPVIDLCYKNRIEFYAGEERDLVNRLYMAGKAYDADIVVRIWGDSPLIQAKFIDTALANFNKRKSTYLTVPTRDAVIAVTTLAELEKYNRELKDPKDREWIHTYMSTRPDSRTVVRYAFGNTRTVDTMEDLQWARRRLRNRRKMNGKTS